MREFILLALKARTDDFALDKTEAGLVCRTVSNALWMSKGVRKDTIIHVVLNGPPSPPKTVSFYGKDMIGGGFDEQSIMGMLKISLEKGAKLTLHQQVESQPGIVVAKESFEALVQQKAATNQLIYLHPRGEDIRSFNFVQNPTFILGDLFGIPKNTEHLLKRLGAMRVKLGPHMLFASHCPIIVHNELDRREK
ncbi:TPA: tRNA (pseudouridine(54)-N(1))-methyltransferase TrmY [Candidatus Woesearchaeota archaeon]|nr:tRNA (pseudouridine(54)-N(1))-methyltransferase TrmY [Candidatus Woesearchaeota archaeon]HIG93882.1 tRNA (pseudouridine(54)-N(1))-methyltransferase TrmY [Candidatus Woesearchaeota archaeon]HIH12987.1 tRNA (pseudouridine(54)-N(1))-methyltransferase TrmY [Candidatus Woesearchaeota archaeon]